MIADDKYKKMLEQLSARVSQEMKQNLINAGKGSSRLINQLKLTVNKSSNGLVIKTDLPEYAIFVDAGRKPGKQPPLQSILDWCRRKGIPEGAAFPIARKIGREGIKPTNFMDPLRKMSEIIVEKSGVIVAEYIISQIKKTFKK